MAVAQRPHQRFLTLLVLCLASLPSLALHGHGRFALVIEEPAQGQLSAVGDVPLRLRLPRHARVDTLEVAVDGTPLPSALLSISGEIVSGHLAGLAAGRHEFTAQVQVVPGERRGAPAHARGPAARTVSAGTSFVLVELENPADCEILNQVSCALPFPSSRFLEPADTSTGFRVAFGPATFPRFNRASPPFGTGPLDPTPFRRNDGFSPTVQILMHFPDGFDPVLSDVPRIDPLTRVYGDRGLDRDSPTLLLDFETGERINHFVENDARATDPGRRLTFLRPATSLRPGHRYIVAVRDLVQSDGQPVESEPVFANIRDGLPSTIPAVEERRAQLEPVLHRLRRFGVQRRDLILAFDFVVQSDHSLTHEMLAMRDEGFAWLADQEALGLQTFRVERVEEVNPGCADPAQPIWRHVEGTFQVPLYLDSDPFFQDPGAGIFRNRELSFLNRDADGAPVADGVTEAPFGIGIPCAIFDGDDGFRPLPPIVIGHGLFGDGAGTVRGLTRAEGLESFDFVAGGTNWSGLSAADVEGCNFDPSSPALGCFLFKVVGNLDNVGALADRLRQGQLDTLILARMLKTGAFHSDPAFQDPAGRGVIDVTQPLYYFGASLGGIMGTMFAALTPDAERLNVDVPAINFSLLLQRAKPFRPFQLLLDLLVNADPLEQAIGIGAIHELWVRGEPAGYATHVTADPLPGVPFPKRILMTVALYDQQVSNLGSILAGNTLGLPNLEGSVLRGLPGMRDTRGPQDSAFVVYDTGSYDPENPAHLQFIPPLFNAPAERDDNRCDPHGLRGFIPASIDQLLAFLKPDGQVQNFCTDDGICNASEPNELPGGASAPCDPV